MAATGLLCASAAGTEIPFAEAVALHDAGRDGDPQATARAVEAFGILIETDAENPLANAYLGSSYALLARDARSVTDKVRYINRGLRHLDTAVALAPDNFVVRLVRANVTASLPAMFGREDGAIEDMLALDAIFSVAQSPAMASQMIGIYSLLADMAPEAGDWQARAESARVLAGM